MAEETQYIGYKEIDGEGYMAPKRRVVKCRCLRCGHVYTKKMPKTWKLTDPDPPCPKKACKAAIAAEEAIKRAENVESMIETGRTPGHIGNNDRVKAVDETAKIVMEDYQMSDLKDNIRAGDTMIPGLTPRQREMSKNFWGGMKQSDRKRNPTYQLGVQAKNKQMIDSAMSGQYLPNVAGSVPRDSVTGDTVLTDLHRRRYRPPVDVIYDTNRGKK